MKSGYSAHNIRLSLVKEKNMDVLQKLIIGIVVISVVSGLIWFIFMAH